MEINQSTELLRNLNRINMDIYEMAHARIGTEWHASHVCTGYSRIYLIIDGGGKICYDNCELMLEAGNIYIIPSGLEFSYECEKYLEKLYFHISINQLNNYDMLSELKKCVVVRNAQQYILKLSDCFFENTMESLFNIKIILHKIILAAIEENTELCGSIKCCSDFMTKTLSFIENNLSAGLTVSETADKMFVSVSKLQKAFKSEMGVSAGRYINDRLMFLAEREMRGGKKSIKEISDMLGFCDQFYFSRRFSERFGVSPLKYRKENRI